MAASCDRELKLMEDDFNAQEIAFHIDAEDSVSSVVGYPDKTRANYKSHQRLFNALYNYIVQSGQISSYQIDAWDIANQWRNFYTERFLTYQGGKGSQHTTMRLNAMFKQFDKIRKKRNKVLKNRKPGKDGMSNTARALMPPAIFAMRADRFGFVSKLVEKTKHLSDRVRQSYASFDADIKKTLRQYDVNVENLIKSGVVDLDNIMDGLHGMYDKENNRIIIRERGKKANGTTIYRVEYVDEDAVKGKKPLKWLSASTLGITDTQYQKAFISKYKDEFVNDLMHGQKRALKWIGFDKASKEAKLMIDHEVERETARAERGLELKDRNLKTMSGVTIEDDDGNIVFEGDIKYLMIKYDEKSGVELYETHIVALKPNGEQEMWHDAKSDMAQLLTGFMKDGYYDAQTEMTYEYFQQRLSAEQLATMTPEERQEWLNAEDHIEDNQFKDYSDFQYMEQQPDNQMIEGRTISTSKGVTYANVWDVMSQYRVVYNKVAKKMGAMIVRNDFKYDRLLKTIRAQLSKKGLSEEESNAWIQENILNVGGIETYSWRNPENGEIHTPDGLFRHKEQNYAPTMWSAENFYTQLDAFQKQLEEYLKNPNTPPHKIAEYKQMILHIADMRMYTSKRYAADDNLHDATRTVHGKQKVLWTDGFTRRKDSQVSFDYMDKTFRNLQKNELMVDLMEQMNNILRTDRGMPMDTIEYMVNRTKLAFGRPDVISRTLTPLGWIRSDNEKIANIMNKLPKWLRGGRTWDAKSAENLWLRVNGLLTMRFLGASGAVGNRSQVINNFIVYGTKIYGEMLTELDDKEKSDYWDNIVNETGVLNLISMFNDVMLQGGMVDTFDMGYLPFSSTIMEEVTGAGVPIPTTNFTRWVKLLRAGRDSFVRNKDKSIDSVLLKILSKKRTESNKEQDISYIRKVEVAVNEYKKTGELGLEQYFSPEELAELAEARGNYYDIVMMKKDDMNEEILRNRFQKLLGDVEEYHLKKMVTWKLSWWMDKSSQALFTFTEGEQLMRKQTAVMALLAADAQSLLGSKTNQDRFTTPAAIKIARDAVYATMFGMSPVFLGEGFSGIGRMFGQYKSYPLFQAIRDWEVMQNFMQGGEGRVTRLLKAAYVSAGRNYDIGDTTGKIDHEAHAALRLLSTRVAATGIALTMALLPFGAFTLRTIERGMGVGTPIGTQGLMRSLENPVVAMTLRLILWSTLMYMGAGDEEDRDKLQEDWFTRVLFLTIPAILGAFARDTVGVFTKLHDD